jgi:hypothetical protein
MKKMKKYGIFVHPGKELTTPRQRNYYKEDVCEMVAQIIAVVVCQSYDTYIQCRSSHRATRS